MTARAWVVRLSAAAEADYQDILVWTVERFGTARALTYAETVSEALAALAAGPAIVGVKARDDISKGLCTLHVARQGRRGRHLILFRVADDENRPTVDVLRLLHDAMDLVRHIPRAAPGDSDT
ncbi:MAG: type II toxin-antitoxin system RelE/ParE family toxin [Alphaproteobacteria bacterium]